MDTLDRSQPLAVLVSGGLDSAILLAEAARAGFPAVHPIYVRFALAWEEDELAHLDRFLEAIAAPALRSLVVLAMPVRDLYGSHWSVTGEGVPGAQTPDEAVFLPGRNVLLLAKALVWCHLHQVPAVAMAPLESNPFPDATPEFFRAFEGAVDLALPGGRGDGTSPSISGRARIVCPYAGLHKVEVLRRGWGLPLEWTFSCISPQDGRHCGVCNKCGERRKGFVEAGLPDPTSYQRRQ